MIHSIWVLGKRFWNVSKVDPQSDLRLDAPIKVAQHPALLAAFLIRLCSIPRAILQAPIKPVLWREASMRMIKIKDEGKKVRKGNLGLVKGNLNVLLGGKDMAKKTMFKTTSD